MTDREKETRRARAGIMLAVYHIRNNDTNTLHALREVTIGKGFNDVNYWHVITRCGQLYTIDDNASLIRADAPISTRNDHLCATCRKSINRKGR